MLDNILTATIVLIFCDSFPIFILLCLNNVPLLEKLLEHLQDLLKKSGKIVLTQHLEQFLWRPKFEKKMLKLASEKSSWRSGTIVFLQFLKFYSF